MQPGAMCNGHKAQPATGVSSLAPIKSSGQCESEQDAVGRGIDEERLAARGKSPPAFERRCIPSDCVARRSNMPDILAPRALSAGRIGALGATPDFCHGLLAVAMGGVAAGRSERLTRILVTLPALRRRRNVLCPSFHQFAPPVEQVAAKVGGIQQRRTDSRVFPRFSVTRNFQAHSPRHHPVSASNHPYRPYYPDHSFRAVILPMLGARP